MRPKRSSSDIDERRMLALPAAKFSRAGKKLVKEAGGEKLSVVMATLMSGNINASRHFVGGFREQ